MAHDGRHLNASPAALARGYERIWVALLEHPWRSLAVVPATAGLSASTLARGVAQVGSDYKGEAIRFVPAEGARLGGSRKLLDSLGSGAPFSCVISTDSPSESEAALLLARNVDGVLLVVPLERARLRDVRHLVELIGRARVLGAVSVSARG
jgi:hypothetical protein